MGFYTSMFKFILKTDSLYRIFLDSNGSFNVFNISNITYYIYSKLNLKKNIIFTYYIILLYYMIYI